MKELYPPIEPYATYALDTGDGHSLHVEECGNAAGLPVIYLHGGPGSGCKSYHRCFFHAAKFRIVLFDQRGSGRSTPYGWLENNTTQHLLADMEAIREKLGIERWLIFAGSWGATLGLLYAQQHPRRVSGMVLRGTFLARQRDLDWYLDEGVGRIYPEQMQALLDLIPAEGHSDRIASLLAILSGSDQLAQRRVARAWSAWGGQVALGEKYDPNLSDEPISALQVQQSRLELHYAHHRYFIAENQILEQADHVPPVPLLLIHGRRDLMCPVEAAYSLHRKLPKSELRILPNAGHIAAGNEMIDALVTAADEMAELIITS